MEREPLIEPTAPKGAVRAVSHALRDLIVRGQLAAGAPLIERRLAARLSVSRATVRSALRQLEQEEYVVSATAGKYSRATVAPLTCADMEELYELIGALNGIAARRVAAFERRDRLVLADDLERLNHRLANVARTQPADFSAIYEIDCQLHARYIEAAGSRRLWTLYSTIIPQGERYGRVYATALVAEISTSIAEHERIIRAIRNGDADGAERAAAANWRNASARFRVVIESLGERGTW